jgi:hypothetical protein
MTKGAGWRSTAGRQGCGMDKLHGRARGGEPWKRRAGGSVVLVGTHMRS